MYQLDSPTWDIIVLNEAECRAAAIQLVKDYRYAFNESIMFCDEEGDCYQYKVVPQFVLKEFSYSECDVYELTYREEERLLYASMDFAVDALQTLPYLGYRDLIQIRGKDYGSSNEYGCLELVAEVGECIEI